MFIAGSTPKSNDSTRSLAARAEERFFTLDHVGVVRHFEGVDLDRVVSSLGEMVGAQGRKVEQATEDLRGRLVHTCVVEPWQSEPLILWLTATQVEGVGVVVDAKIFHPTEQSAEADEELSRLMGDLERRITTHL
ncbi:MAG: hypothetical protein LYZ70_06165 [Nitrososphaerales archaeon]|nr:hypothetical protein [Nitrososphaerales archaeon]